MVMIVMVLLWAFAVYVCSYDWEDEHDRWRTLSERRERREMIRRMWQRDGANEKRK